MHARAIQQGHGYGCEPVIDRRASVKSSRKGRVARSVAALPRFRENRFEPFGVMRESVNRLVGFPQPPEDGFAFLIRTKCKIGPADSCQQPTHWLANGGG